MGERKRGVKGDAHVFGFCPKCLEAWGHPFTGMGRQREVRVWGEKNQKYPLDILSLRWLCDVQGGCGGDTGVRCLG